MTHNSCINAQTGHEQEMMSGLRSWLDPPGAACVGICSTRWRLLTIVSGRKREGFYLNMPNIYLASLAIDDGQRRFNRVHRYTNLTCPHMAVPPGITPTILCWPLTFITPLT